MGPNTPLTIKQDFAKDVIWFHYGDRCLLKCKVAVCRSESQLSTKDAGVRLFVVSKVDGWDSIVQKVRIAGIAMTHGDRLRFVTSFPIDKGSPLETLQVTCCHESGAVEIQDDMLQFKLCLAHSAMSEIVVKSTARCHTAIEAIADEVHFDFRPCFTGPAG